MGRGLRTLQAGLIASLVAALVNPAIAIALPQKDVVTSSSQPWLDTSLDTEARLEALMQQWNRTQMYAMLSGDRLVKPSLTTKHKQLTDAGTGVNACAGHISGNESLGIPAICMGDGPGGVGNSLDNVTTFPAPVLNVATWNTTKMYLLGQAMGREHKAKARNVVLSPTINILRSPLWGRADETFSEDPFLTARFGVAQVTGIQSEDMLACPKHFAAYNQETLRYGLLPELQAYEVNVEERVLHEVYFPAFKAVVQEGKAAGIMCAYSKLNGEYVCANQWLLDILKKDWGFTGWVVSDWFFSTRSTVSTVMGGTDISMPGGSLEKHFGLPEFYGKLLIEAVDNGSIPFERVEDMVRRIWRPMFEHGAIDHPSTGNSLAVARTQEHLDLTQDLIEEGIVLLKNDDETLPINAQKYKKIAVFGIGATNVTQVSENHGGFVNDETMIVQAPFDEIARLGKEQNITVVYSEAYPGTGNFKAVPSSMFPDGLQVAYYTTTDWTGPINQTLKVDNITAAIYPTELAGGWPQVFSSIYTGTFLPTTTGLYHFSLTGHSDALLTINNNLIANMSGANFENTIQGVVHLTSGVAVPLELKFSMGHSVLPGKYGITLGVSVGNTTRDSTADALAAESDLSIIFVSDRQSEGVDNNLGLSLPGDQDLLISRLSKLSKRTLVVANTNSAILMPWIDDVDAVMEAWYSGQQIGLALGRLLYGHVNPSGKLPVTFPRALNDTIPITGDLVVDFEEGLFVGYKWFDEKGIEPLFPFGHGLSYTTFALSDLELSTAEIEGVESVVASLTLSNTGCVSGKQVVQLYVSYPEAAMEPPKLLKGFEKVYLESEEEKEVDIVVKKEELRIWDPETKDWRLVEGEYRFLVGFSAGDIVVEEGLYIS
ncbi:hypothetical protein HYFRA_00001489 [Hymenoscyphus fraxineus]|uniref:beta-glucosidase n=1 Tax=Hymenoscyphus fraxineus TaxID=746836 RepID=A0A9N9PZC9_9HELO|nr:hypothetical protein HYFRA_00001489 [Hymenoscyphus fraxineus]